jgi:hypothetical protein
VFPVDKSVALKYALMGCIGEQTLQSFIDQPTTFSDSGCIKYFTMAARQGVPGPDLATAKMTAVAVCDQAIRSSAARVCYQAGQLHSSAAEKSVAAKLYAKACDEGGNLGACSRARSLGVVVDEKAAREQGQFIRDQEREEKAERANEGRQRRTRSSGPGSTRSDSSSSPDSSSTTAPDVSTKPIKACLPSAKALCQ